jgi:peroxiredoxin
MTISRNSNERRQRAARSGLPAKTGPAKTSRPGARRSASRQLRLREQRRQESRRRARRAALLWAAAAIVIAAVVTTALLVTRAAPLQHSVARQAPVFTLPSTSGTTVSLASYRSHNVVLYFNEGVGCDACFYQMGQFEQDAAQLRAAGITIVPIVMNLASQVRPELAAFGLHTSYLIDTTGAVSRAYGVLGKGMHAGLPGHGFVLIDARGIERWYGEYPSMHLATAGLIAQVQAHLHG